MNCKRTRDAVDRALDDGSTLAPSVESHIATCDACRTHADRMKALGAHLAEGAQEVLAAAPAPDVDRVLTAVNEEPAPTARRMSRPRRILIGLAVAAVVLVMASRSPEPPDVQTEPSHRPTAAAVLSPEQLEAVRVLAGARAQLISDLSRSERPHVRGTTTYGRQIVDGPLTAEMNGIQSSVRSLEAFLVECLPMPVIAEESGQQGHQSGIRRVGSSRS